MAEFEIKEVKTREVHCDGGKGSLGHPRVYLTISPDKLSITCPYCSKKFVMAKDAA